MKKQISRVPQIILLYWIIKIASTTLGETGADMFSMTFNLGYSTTIFIFLFSFIILLGVKLMQKSYEPITYWLVFTSTAILGTALSDFIDRTLHLGYTQGSILLLTMLLFSLGFWYFQEKSIDVEVINTKKIELYYWISFLIANTLGTAAGDYLADELQIGFMKSAMIIAGILALTALCHYWTNISKTLLFWIAFVLTRPFGATFGDLLTKNHRAGGLDFGTVGSSLFFAIILVMALTFEVYGYQKDKKTIKRMSRL
jgi:uncharacterized membrane-anchored protein